MPAPHVPCAFACAQVTSTRLLDETEMRHLFQSYNALLNAGFVNGHADRLGGAPRYGAAVRLVGMPQDACLDGNDQSGDGGLTLNGLRGVVSGVLDRRRCSLLLAPHLRHAFPSSPASLPHRSRGRHIDAHSGLPNMGAHSGRVAVDLEPPADDAPPSVVEAFAKVAALATPRRMRCLAKPWRRVWASGRQAVPDRSTSDAPTCLTPTCLSASRRSARARRCV